MPANFEGIDLRLRIAQAVAILNNETFRKVEEVLASGPMVSELGIDWDPPLFELVGGMVVATEQMRIL